MLFQFSHLSLQKATDLLERCVTKFKSRHEITFLTGVVGPLALTAVILHSQRKQEEAKQLILKYINPLYFSTLKCLFLS